jgi:ribokinase
MDPLNVILSACRYRVLLGVGGIGTGAFFALNGGHTLGREESRSGHFIDRRDYCKLHIISHYVQTLLGAEFVTLPIGRVGADEAGNHLLNEMAAAGMNLRYTRTIPGSQTLYSFCFIYPDGSGGNLTTDNSACGLLSPEDVEAAEADFQRFQGRGIALAAPEVPLTARWKLLEMGTRFKFLRVAIFNSTEIRTALALKMLAMTDLLALNRDEAAAVAAMPAEDASSLSVVEASLARLMTINPAMQVTVTAGKEGSWSWDGSSLHHQPAYPTRMVSTAGAGDAFLAGIIAGLVAALPLHRAQELGTLVAALSVTSPHTIDGTIDRRSLQSFADEFSLDLSESIRQLLED